MKKNIFSIIASAGALPILAVSMNFKNYNYSKDDSNLTPEDIRLGIKLKISKILKTSKNNIEILKEKEIELYNGEKLLLLQFLNKGYAVFSLETFELIEYNPLTNLTDEQFEKINGYIPLKSLVVKEKNLFKSVSSNFTQNEELSDNLPTELLDKENKQILRKENTSKLRKNIKISKLNDKFQDRTNNATLYDPSEPVTRLNADYEVDYSWWFKSNQDFFGYADLTNNYEEFRHAFGDTRDYSKNKEDEQGICEYISLSMLIQYYQLFKNSNWLSEAQFNEYANVFDVDQNHNHILSSGFNVYNKYAQNNYNFLKKNNLPIYPIFSPKLSYQLFLNDGTINIHNASHYKTSLLKTVKNNNLKTGWNTTYLFNRPWEIIYKNNPVILGGYISAYTNGVEDIWHSVLAYGKWYDKGDTDLSNLYLVHYGFGSENMRYSQVAVSARYLRHIGYEFHVWDKTKNPTLKKYFNYNGKMVDASELPKHISFN
ncbi:hypothetical protein EG856_01730 [Mycoplasmopsis phocirhinis]|uniref:Uncharacterized protein n=1 Tax=Mycoplasmopsis phocirhinis TaxID=142650 RepID=A0A4P6MTG4_9BACT|nr:hypothetical protein [Mycoplasmopsis phocirhinis]QBF34637.1 hypothetical protein EG856_01730 [Mycoplasmopsis phocirhinis]